MSYAPERSITHIFRRHHSEKKHAKLIRSALLRLCLNVRKYSSLKFTHMYAFRLNCFSPQSLKLLKLLCKLLKHNRPRNIFKKLIISYIKILAYLMSQCLLQCAQYTVRNLIYTDPLLFNLQYSSIFLLPYYYHYYYYYYYYYRFIMIIIIITIIIIVIIIIIIIISKSRSSHISVSAVIYHQSANISSRNIYYQS
jgi:hypothetical protein